MSVSHLQGESEYSKTFNPYFDNINVYNNVIIDNNATVQNNLIVNGEITGNFTLQNLVVKNDNVLNIPNQIVIEGLTNDNKQIDIGYNTTLDKGSIIAQNNGVIKPLQLNIVSNVGNKGDVLLGDTFVDDIFGFTSQNILNIGSLNFNGNSITPQSNGDLSFSSTGGGSYSVILENLRINNNNIFSNGSNTDINISPDGSGNLNVSSNIDINTGRKFYINNDDLSKEKMLMKYSTDEINYTSFSFVTEDPNVSNKVSVFGIGYYPNNDINNNPVQVGSFLSIPGGPDSLLNIDNIAPRNTSLQLNLSSNNGTLRFDTSTIAILDSGVTINCDSGNSTKINILNGIKECLNVKTINGNSDWIAASFTSDFSNGDKVVIGTFNSVLPYAGGATIGGHTNILNGWRPFHINSGGDSTNNVTIGPYSSSNMLCVGGDVDILPGSSYKIGGVLLEDIIIDKLNKQTFKNISVINNYNIISHSFPNPITINSNSNNQHIDYVIIPAYLNLSYIELLYSCSSNFDLIIKDITNNQVIKNIKNIPKSNNVDILKIDEFISFKSTSSITIQILCSSHNQSVSFYSLNCYC